MYPSLNNLWTLAALQKLFQPAAVCCSEREFFAPKHGKKVFINTLRLWGALQKTRVVFVPLRLERSFGAVHCNIRTAVAKRDVQ